MPNVFETTHRPRYEKEGYKYLATIPEVARFLNTPIFDRITRVRELLISACGENIVFLEFDVVAPKLMPHPRARLLEHGLVTRNNLLDSGKMADGIRQTIGFFCNKLQIALNIRSADPTPEAQS